MHFLYIVDPQEHKKRDSNACLSVQSCIDQQIIKKDKSYSKYRNSRIHNVLMQSQKVFVKLSFEHKSEKIRFHNISIRIKF